MYKRLSPGKRTIGSPEGGGKSFRQAKAAVNTLPDFLFLVVLYSLEENKMRYNQLARNGYYTQALSLALLINRILTSL